MSIASHEELLGMRKVSEVVALALRKMREYALPGMDCRELDEYGGRLILAAGANPAPKMSYGFPGYTCISVNHEVAHGIPASTKILREGDLVNIDVSAELDGFWSDNGGSFVLGGKDPHAHQPLVDASEEILMKAIATIRPGMRIAELGRFIESSARKRGYRVIRNLVGHGIGRKLHEHPKYIPNYYDGSNIDRFRKNMVVAIETFISTGSVYAKDSNDGWTLVSGDKSFVAQHEHTIMITDELPLILTAANGIGAQ